MLADRTLAEAKVVFSPFATEHLARAVQLASQLMKIADRRLGKAGLTDAIDEIEKTRKQMEIPGLVEHATKLFITHHPLARMHIRLRPLEQRQPNLVRPSKPSVTKSRERT